MLNTDRSRPDNARRPRRKQGGVAMFEVLISLLVLSFGMLGMAKLQSATLGMRHSSMHRSQAIALTDDILERMRADRMHARDGDWNSPATQASADLDALTLAHVELKDWKQQIENVLPAGGASVSVSSGVVTVVVQWDDSKGRAAAQEFSTTSTL